jgi:mitochondrial ribonuclease P protein 3
VEEVHRPRLTYGKKTTTFWILPLLLAMCDSAKDEQPAAKRPRPDMPADLPLSVSSIPAVQELIKENNQQRRPKHRLGQRDFLNHAFDKLGMEAKKDSSVAGVVLDFLEEMATAHHELPRNTTVSKVLYAWGSSPDLVDAGVRVVTAVLQHKNDLPAAFCGAFDERVAAVSLRLAVQAIDVDMQLIRRVIDAIPPDAFKRRVFQPLFAHCRATANAQLCFEFFEMACAKNLELWDTDYHDVLCTVNAAAAAATLSAEEALSYAQCVLEEMEQQHPVVGAASAKLIQKLMGGVVTSVSDDGVCAHCGSQLQSFDLSLEDRAVLVHDVVEKLVRPRVEGTSRYEPDAQLSDEVKQQRWKEFDAFKAAVAAMDYDTVIDGANVGYYGLSSWYMEAKDALLRSRGVDPATVPSADRFNVPFPVDVSPKFSLIEDMRAAAERHGKKAIIVLHNRHLSNPTPDNVPFADKWNAMGALLPSPGFLNDDYCWLYAVLTRRDSCIISNDQMRDHHFCMLQPRFFVRWRQRHRITYKAMYNRASRTATLRVHLPRKYSVWVQLTAPRHWHIPYIASIDILHQATNQTTSTSADVELGKDGDDDCSDWICTKP